MFVIPFLSFCWLYAVVLFGVVVLLLIGDCGLHNPRLLRHLVPTDRWTSGDGHGANMDLMNIIDPTS